MDTWTVSELTRYIKELLDSAPGLAELWVAGELSNWSRARSGHCYFTLKDDQAEIPCVMWRGAADRLTFEPRVGDWVQALGSVSVYERGGKYQFYATALQRAGVGVLWERFLALKNRLEQEGLFDESRKRPLPSWPRRIGVVTSPTGAALRDILNVLNERYPVVEVVLSPSVVQGTEAPAGLVAGRAPSAATPCQVAPPSNDTSAAIRPLCTSALHSRRSQRATPGGRSAAVVTVPCSGPG